MTVGSLSTDNLVAPSIKLGNASINVNAASVSSLDATYAKMPAILGDWQTADPFSVPVNCLWSPGSTDDYVTISENKNYPYGSDTMSLDLWVYIPEKPRTYEVILSCQTNLGQSRPGLSVFVNSDGHVNICGSMNISSDYSPKPLADAQWHYIAVSLSSTGGFLWWINIIVAKITTDIFMEMYFMCWHQEILNTWHHPTGFIFSTPLLCPRAL